MGCQIPLNIKFCFEGMEESGSEGLDAMLWKKKDTFLKVRQYYICLFTVYRSVCFNNIDKFDKCVIHCFRILTMSVYLTIIGWAKKSLA